MINLLSEFIQPEQRVGALKNYALQVVSEATASFTQDIQDMQKLWNVYNGKFNAAQYNYLTKIDPKSDLVFPAKVRDVGSQIVRSKINILESEQASRKPRFKAVACDERSQKEKYERRLRAVLDAIDASVSDKYLMLESTIQQVNEQMQDVEKQLQVEPENEEMAARLQEMKANMPLIRLEYQRMLRELKRQSVDMQELNSRVASFRNTTEVDIAESLANAFIKSIFVDPDKRDDFNIAFREKIVTGCPTYFVNYNKKTKKVDFRALNAIRSFYSRATSSKWSNTSDWCATLEYMSPTQIAAEFNLSSVELAQVNSMTSGTGTTPMMSYQGNSAVFLEGAGRTKDESMNGGIQVWRVWWLAPREWWWVKSPNKYREGEYFHHAVTDRKSLRKRDGEIAERGIIYDRYSAVVIGGSIVKDLRVDDEVYRPQDNPAIPMMPIVRRVFNTGQLDAFSLVKRTDQLRELYDVVMYALELNIVLSGVRGLVMDKSQKPDSMSTPEWQYFRRMGTAWIETMKKGRKVPATFNQFQTYDDTMSDSVAIVFEILNGIEGMIGKIIGVTDPRLGQTVAKDPVHNVMMSQEQSSLITEVQFYDSDTVYAQALSQYLNLVFRYEIPNGKVINFLDENKQEVMYRIPGGIMNKSDFTIKAFNNIQEDHMLDMIRSQAQATGIGIDGVASLFRVESLSEMEARLAQIITEQQQRQTQSQMSIDDNKAQREQETLRLKSELEQYNLQLKAQLEQAKIELDKIRLQSELEYSQWEMGFKERELEVKANTDILNISSENEIEASYLKETQRSNMVKESLEMHRQRIEALLGSAQLKEQSRESDKKADVDIKKAELTAVRRKNNIKD